MINALNEDMPYDLFVKAHFAADLLPGVDAATRGFLGLTVQCAQMSRHRPPRPTQVTGFIRAIHAVGWTPKRFAMPCCLWPDRSMRRRVARLLFQRAPSASELEAGVAYLSESGRRQALKTVGGGFGMLGLASLGIGVSAGHLSRYAYIE